MSKSINGFIRMKTAPGSFTLNCFALFIALSPGKLICHGTDRSGSHTPAGLDLMGDPVPGAARARLGSVRLRHHQRVRCLSLSPDGKVVASAGGQAGDAAGHAIRLWDVVTGGELRQLFGHSAAITAIRFSPDGETLASAAHDSVRIWDVRSGKQLHCLRPPAGPLTVIFSPSGNTLAFSARDGAVYLWDLPTANMIHVWTIREAEGAEELAFSADGAVLSSLSGRVLRLFDVSTKRIIQTTQIRWKHYAISGLVLADRKEIGTRGKYGAVRWWDTATGEHTRELPGQWLASSADGNLLALLVGDEIALWNVAQKREVRRLRAPDSYCFRYGVFVRFGALSSDGSILAIPEEGSIRLVDTRAGKTLHSFAGHWAPVEFVGFSRDGRQLISAGDLSVRVWDVRTAKELRCLLGTKRPIEGASITADGTVLATGGGDSGVLVWDLVEGKEIRQLPLRGYSPFAIAPDGRSVTTDAGCWDVATGKQVQPFVQHLQDRCSAFAFLPDGRAMAVRSTSIRIVDAVTWQTIREFDRLPGTWHDSKVAISPDGRMLATALPDRSREPGSDLCVIALWEVFSGKLLGTLQGHETPVCSFAFSPLPMVLASGGWDGTVRLWDIASGREIARFQGHQGGVLSLGFSPDGKLLASGGSDTTILIWDVPALLPVKKAATPLSDHDLAKLWADLLSDSGSTSYRAMATLVTSPQQTVPFLQKKLGNLRPASALVKEFVSDLDSERFDLRQKAMVELTAFGPAVLPMLRKLLNEKPSPEVRRRLELILAKLDSLGEGSPSLQHFRGIRAIQILEYIGSSQARQVLDDLADQLNHPLKDEAKTTVERLKNRRVHQP